MEGWIFLALWAGAYGLGYWRGLAKARQRELELQAWKKKAEAEMHQQNRMAQYQLEMEAARIQENRRINEVQLQQEKQRVERKLEEDRERIEKYQDGRELAFQQGFCQGRKWLADFIAESQLARDARVEDYLRYKQHPAERSADVVKKIRAEKRELASKLKCTEYQIRSYEEYFPFLEEYREAILEELVPLGTDKDNKAELEESDPVIRFLSKDEYNELTPAEKHQRALERYIERSKSAFEAGIMYERYLGYLYEAKGWRVAYEGAIKGFEDFGRDLICLKEDTIRIVQAKRWHSERIVREKHIFQLYGTTCLYKRKHKDMKVQAQFCTTTEYSKEARYVASDLGIHLRTEPFNKDYPMIKCNVNPSTRERIYHLPFDQQYDRTVIGTVPGECYAKTAYEAEEKGFRRAWRYHGPMN